MIRFNFDYMRSESTKCDISLSKAILQEYGCKIVETKTVAVYIDSNQDKIDYLNDKSNVGNYNNISIPTYNERQNVQTDQNQLQSFFTGKMFIEVLDKNLTKRDLYHLEKVLSILMDQQIVFHFED